MKPVAKYPLAMRAGCAIASRVVDIGGPWPRSALPGAALGKGAKVLLQSDIPSHEARRQVIKAGTPGVVIATRHLPDDAEPLALVKFARWGGHRSIAVRLLRKES